MVLQGAAGVKGLWRIGEGGGEVKGSTCMRPKEKNGTSAKTAVNLKSILEIEPVVAPEDDCQE